MKSEFTVNLSKEVKIQIAAEKIAQYKTKEYDLEIEFKIAEKLENDTSQLMEQLKKVSKAIEVIQDQIEELQQEADVIEETEDASSEND